MKKIFFLLVIVITMSCLSAYSQCTRIWNQLTTFEYVAPGTTLCITAGSFTGHLHNDGTVIVKNFASLNPILYAPSDTAKLVLEGGTSALLPNNVFNGNYVIENGGYLVTKNFYPKSLLNKTNGRIRINNDFRPRTGGTLVSSGVMYVADMVYIDSNVLFNNKCEFFTNCNIGIIYPGGKILNEGYFQAADKFLVQGELEMTVGAKFRSSHFKIDTTGKISGSGNYDIIGFTENYGIADGLFANPIGFKDETDTSGRLFDRPIYQRNYDIIPGGYIYDDTANFSCNTILPLGSILAYKGTIDETIFLSYNVVGFPSLERSYDGKNFHLVKKLDETSHSTSDKPDFNQGRVYYRISNGNGTFTEIIVIILKKVVSTMKIVQAQNNFTVTFEGSLIVSNVVGQSIKTSTNGKEHFSLPQGMYYFTEVKRNGARYTETKIAY